MNKTPNPAAQALGRLGGKVRSERKAAAARRNASLPPKPGKQARGRPRKTTQQPQTEQ